jgi:hypothetical protein
MIMKHLGGFSNFPGRGDLAVLTADDQDLSHHRADREKRWK